MAALGTVSMDAAGHFSYTPAAHFNGSNTFNFTANDGKLNSNIATIDVTVGAVNVAPMIPLNEKVQHRLIVAYIAGQHTVQA